MVYLSWSLLSSFLLLEPGGVIVVGVVEVEVVVSMRGAGPVSYTHLTLPTKA